MKKDEFRRLALDKYGDKILVQQIKPGDKVKEAQPKFAEAIGNYPAQPWLVGDKCPECGADLGGLFGSFAWSMIHGIGYCNSCEKVELQLYHYPIEGSHKRFTGYSLVGFQP